MKRLIIKGIAGYGAAMVTLHCHCKQECVQAPQQLADSMRASLAFLGDVKLMYQLDSCCAGYLNSV